MSAQLQEEVQILERRVAKLERLARDLYGKLDAEPPEGVGWWGSGEPDPASQEPSEQVLELLGEGKKLQAIKLHHEDTGLGLAEAQAAVERYESQGS